MTISLLRGSRPVLRSGKSLRRTWRREARVGYLFLLPLAIGLLVFRFYGFGYNVWLSLTEAGAFGPPRFIGFANYAELLSDGQLAIALGNTLKFCVIAVPAVVVASLLCALLMQHRFRGESAFRAIVFLPAVCLPTAIVFVFAWLFQTRYGLVNAALESLGASPVSWFGSATGVTVVVTLVVVYLSFSVPTIILYAGLQELPSDVYEAAKLDGASPLRAFWSLTLPLLSPSIFFVTLTTTISTLKLFDVVYILLPPEESVSVNYGITMLYYYYQLAFLGSGQRGYAAAVSLVLFVLILAVTLLLFRLQRRFVHYGEDG